MFVLRCHVCLLRFAQHTAEHSAEHIAEHTFEHSANHISSLAQPSKA